MLTTFMIAQYMIIPKLQLLFELNYPYLTAVKLLITLLHKNTDVFCSQKSLTIV